MNNFQCEVCFSCLDDPRMVPCGHSFCYQCLQQLKTMNCPLCKREFESVESLPPNYVLKKWMERSSDKAPGTKIMCDNCPEEAPQHATLWCQNCSSNLCGVCSESLHAARATKAHSVLTLKEKRQSPCFTKCPKHFQDKVFYCTTCNELICNVCMMDDHPSTSHVTTSVFKFCEGLRNDMKVQVKKMSEIRSPFEELAEKRIDDLKCMTQKIQRAEKWLTIMKADKERKEKEAALILQSKYEVEACELALLTAVQDMTIMELLDPPSLQLMQSQIPQIHQEYEALMPWGWGAPPAWDLASCCPHWEINGDVVKAVDSAGGGVLATRKLDRTQTTVWKIKILSTPTLLTIGVAFPDTLLTKWSGLGGFDARGWGWTDGAAFDVHMDCYFAHDSNCVTVERGRSFPLSPGVVIEVKLTPDGFLHYRYNGKIVGTHPLPVIADGDLYPAVMIDAQGEVQILRD